MGYRRVIMRVGITALLVAGQWCGLPRIAAADTPVGPQLIIERFKVTSSHGQFVNLYNQTDHGLDLGDFELDYTSSSNKTGSIPLSGTLPSHTYYLLADGAVQLCYQTVVNATSLGFTVTSGSLHLWQVTATDTSKQMTLQDRVSWDDKNGNLHTSPIQLSSVADISYLRQPDGSGGTLVTAPGAGTWDDVLPSPTDPCSLQKVDDGSIIVPPQSGGLTTGQEPAATIISLASDSSAAAAALPPADIGLAAPQITELLPNPDGTGTDGSDEFVELYNPNTRAFDLTGFTLQTGLTTRHSYAFPLGTALPAKGFVAFYSASTGLNLSNTSGQADLEDPFGTVIAQTDPYGAAKDGRAWALANGSWYWTGRPTPNAANKIDQAAAKSKATSAKKASGAVKGAATTSAPGSSTTNSVANSADAAATAPIHPVVLAAVAAAAVGYGVYEYRHDLANRLHQFREHRAARRKARG